jgi:uncharacterized protein
MTKMPQEIEVWYVLPAIRRELSLALKEQGCSQKKAALILQVTEPAISQYLKSKRAKKVVFDEESKKLISLAAERLIKSPELLMPEIQNLCDFLKKRNVVCDLHKTMSSLPEGCQACKR